MISFAAIAAAAALAAVPPPPAAREPLGADVRGGTINIPPEIARQVFPYLQCTMERTNARLPVSDRETARAVRAAALADCAAVRQRGFEEADHILRRNRSHRNQASRHAYINAAFDQIDRSFEPMIERLESRGEPRGQDDEGE